MTKDSGKRTKASRKKIDAAPDEIGGQAAEGMLGPNPFVGMSTTDVFKAAGSLTSSAAQQPLVLMEHQANIVRDLIQVLSGKSELQPTASDKRFADSLWNTNPFYRGYLQSYLALKQGFDRFVGDLKLEGAKNERARFVVSLLTEAASPSNVFLTNPAAIKKAFETGGMSVLHGLSNLVSDLRSNHAMPSQVDRSAFKMGQDLATTPGEVVFRNPVLELIQYAPTTAKVHPRPLLMVPPQINKFYVYDLSPGKSLIKHMVDAGFQVFAVSWRNPTSAQRDWDLDVYVQALLDAIAAVKQITGSKDINIQGACSGAMTLAALLTHLAAKRDRSVHSAALFVAVLDLPDESQLGVFATPETIAAAKAASRAKGVLEGSEMGRVFAWMRPNDLVWNYWVNNYLLGNAPPAFDILFWNNDTTRLTAAFHAQILDIFRNKLFSQPGAMQVLGTPVDLAKVTCDTYVVAGVTDHITPWKSCYRAWRMLGGDLTMVLSGSGHIQSLVNPPDNPKAKYFLNPQHAAEPEAWLEGATETAGSWWDHWGHWLARRSGEPVDAPSVLGSAKFPGLMAAPGSYVVEA
jgi:polyhydroxyalkanoate synthase